MPGTNSPLSLDAAPADLVEAEAEAARAEALAVAARARVRAMRLRPQAEASDGTPSENSATTAVDGVSISSDKAEVPSSAEVVVDPGITDSVAADEGCGPPHGKKARRFRRPKRTTVVVGIAVLCTSALLVVSTLMMRQHEDLMRKEQHAAEFSAAARQIVVTLMSINAGSAKDDVQHIIDSTTGQFRDEFRRAAEDFTKVAQNAKVSTKTSVQATAVDSMTDDTAVVLVAASSTLTNTAGSSEQPRSWRLSLKLAREGGQIKMSSMEFIP